MIEQTQAAVKNTVDTAARDTLTETIGLSSQTDEDTTFVFDSVNGKEVESQAETIQQERVFRPVYNGEVMPIDAADTARVTTLLQKGMKFEHMAEDLEKLHHLTELCGTKSISETIDGLLAEKEQAQLTALSTQYGEQAAQQMLRTQRARYQTYAQADAAADEASQQMLGKRLAQEYAELVAQYPHITQANDIPTEAVELAVKNRISLLDAYNRYTLREQQRAAQAAQQQTANEQAATGSLSNLNTQTINPVWDAFLRGAARAMR